MNEYRIKEFEMYYPEFVDEVEEYLDGDPWELIIKLKDGKVLSYYTPEKSLRYIPVEEECDDETFKEEFGIRLRRKMERAGFLQTTFAEATGIPRPQINNYLNGKRVPSIQTLIKMAAVLKCPLDYFQVFRKF